MAQRLVTLRLDSANATSKGLLRPHLPMQRALARPAKHARCGRLPAYVLQTMNILDQQRAPLDERSQAASAYAIQEIHSVVERLLHNIVTVIAAVERLAIFAVRFVAALVHGGALQAWITRLRRRELEQGVESQHLAHLATERRTHSAVLRAAAKEKQDALTRQLDKEERAFCSMILRQDNPRRSLEDKWADLCLHMHGDGSVQFRNVTSQLYSTACISCASIQEALQGSDPASPPASIGKLLEQHACVQQEEAMRSLLFSQLLTAQQEGKRY